MRVYLLAGSFTSRKKARHNLQNLLGLQKRAGQYCIFMCAHICTLHMRQYLQSLLWGPQSLIYWVDVVDVSSVHEFKTLFFNWIRTKFLPYNGLSINNFALLRDSWGGNFLTPLINNIDREWMNRDCTLTFKEKALALKWQRQNVIL